MNRLLGHAPDGDDIVSVNRDSRETVSFGAVTQIFGRSENIGGVGMGLGAVLDHENNGQSLAGGDAGGFVPETKGGEAVVSHGYHHVRPLLAAVGQRNSRSDIELPLNGCSLRNDSKRWRFAVRMCGEIFLLEIEQLGEDALEWRVADHLRSQLGPRG